MNASGNCLSELDVIMTSGGALRTTTGSPHGTEISCEPSASSNPLGTSRSPLSISSIKSTQPSVFEFQFSRRWCPTFDPLDRFSAPSQSKAHHSGPGRTYFSSVNSFRASSNDLNICPQICASARRWTASKCQRRSRDSVRESTTNGIKALPSTCAAARAS